MAEFNQLVEREVARKRRCGRPPIHGFHEAYGLIQEEVDEFFDQVKQKAKRRNLANSLHELVQIAALCQRTAEDLGLLEFAIQSEKEGE